MQPNTLALLSPQKTKLHRHTDIIHTPNSSLISTESGVWQYKGGDVITKPKETMAKPKPKRVNGNITINVATIATPNGTLHVETAQCYVVVLHQNMKLIKYMIMLSTLRLSSSLCWESVCPKRSSTKRDKSPWIYLTHCGKQWKDFSQCSIFREQYKLNLHFACGQNGPPQREGSVFKKNHSCTGGQDPGDTPCLFT